MSVITSEMMRDMGATSFYDVVDFLPSTFSYGSNEGDGNANGLRTGSPFVVRGYRSDSLSTNFFTANFPVDSYNTDRMTFTRGPNAILFGVGTAAGVALVEVYDVTGAARLMNLSTRAQVGTGAGIIISGLVISPGEGRRRMKRSPCKAASG